MRSHAEHGNEKNDPHETRNLQGEAGLEQVEQEMRDRLLQWLITAGETDQIAPKWLVPR